MSSPFVSEITMFGFNFAPTGWALCQGQLLPISQNTALFSLLGTMYGGDGKSTFALPNLHNRTPVSIGTEPALTTDSPGRETLVPIATLTTDEMVTRNHYIN